MNGTLYFCSFILVDLSREFWFSIYKNISRIVESRKLKGARAWFLGEA